MTKARQKEYARKLYLKIDGTGEQVETIRSIAKNVNEKCDKKRDRKDGSATKDVVHFSTIPRWAVKERWDDELQEIKNEAYRRIKAAEQEDKDQAAADRKQIHGEGSLSIELSRQKNEEDYDTYREILNKKAHFSMLWIKKDFSEHTEAEVKERKLSAWQEAMVFKQVSDVKLKHDELLAEASKFEDNVLEVIYEVVKPPKEIEGK